MAEEQTRKIVTPAYLLRRLEAFRIVRGSEVSYLLRDKIADKTYDFDAWQFFILESLAGSETLERMLTVFQDRFDRAITKAELDEFLGSVVDKGLFDEAAAGHALLAPLMRKTFEVVDGKAVPRPAVVSASTPAKVVAPQPVAAVPAPPPPPRAPAPPAGEGPPPEPEELPAGVQDALGLDWRTTKRFIPLFNPKWMLGVLLPVLSPLRHIIYGVPVLLLAALLLIGGYSHLIIEDLHKLELEMTLVEHLLFVFVTVHVVNTLVISLVAHHFKVSVDKVGIALTFGFMPRWAVKMTGADRMTRSQVMWLHGSALISRLVMFSLGTLVWYATRDAQTELTQVGLLFTLSCAAGLVIEAGNPLIKANGYYLLSAFLNERALRGKAYAALLNKLKGGVYKAADNNLLALYGLLSATYVVFIILLAGYVLGKFFFADLGLSGTAMLVSVAFAAYMLYRNYEGLKKFNDTFERQVQFDRWRSRTLPVEAVEGEVPAKRRMRYWRTALLVCAVLALFLPYPYEPGGSFTVFPVRRANITSDVAGVVTEVMFNGGESVKQGTVLARLAVDDIQAQVNTLDAQINEQKAVIANLKSLPKPEEIRVAEQQLELARSYVPFSRDKYNRLKDLLASGAVTLEEVETARKEHEIDKSQVIEKEAALALAKAGPTKDQIAAADAKLASLQEQRSGIAAKAERGVLRMPFDGNILTLHLKDKTNSYLPVGQSLAEVENTGQITAQIDIVESDIQYVKLGATVMARPTSYYEEDFQGKVTLIDRNVTPKSFGNVVRVLATFENADGRLKTGMAGQAKITAVTMPVWKAFSQSVVRFVRLQLWAWVP